MLEKRYTGKDFEEILYQRSTKYFKPKGIGKSFTIMMPPPNVTGTLHLGHALTFTLQDAVVRWKRLKGFDVLYQPGTDHAGIALQHVVERKMHAEGKARTKEIFTQEAWAFKEFSQNKIVEQQKKLAISPDWERSRFSLDEGMNQAVNKAFKTLYDDGLIYKDQCLVNWDFKLRTAISDLEVINKDVKGFMYYIRYPTRDSNSQGIVVATTRPETLFGDTAIVVNPEDERYKNMIGHEVVVPICGRVIKVIPDDNADPSLGTGCVKITPAHDFNDFEVGKRHNLELINILDDNGRLNENVPEIFRGLAPLEAREKIVGLLGDLGLMEKIEEFTHSVPHGEKSDIVVEPRLTQQWFLKAEVLAVDALKVLYDGKLRFIPESWANTYISWLKNIRPWCISRQLWWGHQIPAWYGPDGKIFVEGCEEQALEKALKHYGKSVELIRDQDVLDTWFSSALWPFSTLGWPSGLSREREEISKTDDLSKYFPTDLLVTGFDIIFFWVARMVMMSLYLTKEVPFKDVYIHALVRDEKGQKMSKTKGNVIDPLELIDQYGVDALRLALCALSVPGRDINIGPSKVESYRNFITKLWNAGRFLEAHQCQDVDNLEKNHLENLSFKHEIRHPFNQWILQKFKESLGKIDLKFEEYRFDQIVELLYDFVWTKFCDVYLEGAKVLFDNPDFQKETKAVAKWVYKEILVVLHPIIPLVTQRLRDEFDHEELIISKWPEVHYDYNVGQVDYLLDVALEIRSIKGLLEINKKIDLMVSGDEAHIKLLMNPIFMHLAMINKLNVCEDSGEGTPFVIGSLTFYFFEEKIQQILEQKLLKIESDLIKLKAFVDNEKFKIAKPEAWEEKHQDYQAQLVLQQKIAKCLMKV